MKKIKLVILVTITIINFGFSQSKKNDIKVSLSALPLLGKYTENNNSSIDGITLKTSIGYNLADKTSLELSFAYTTQNNGTVENIDSFYKSYVIIPSLRRTFVNNQKWRLFGEIGAGLGGIRYDSDIENMRIEKFNELSGGIYVLNIGLGINYYLNNKFGFEFIVPYIDTNNFTSKKPVRLYSGFAPTIGITYTLN